MVNAVTRKCFRPPGRVSGEVLGGSVIYNRPAYEPDKHGRPIQVDVRPATPDDIEAIARIDEVYGIGSVETLVPRILASFERVARGEVRAYTCVAPVKGEVVGYGICKFNVWSEKHEESGLPDGWYLSGLQVLSSHRRRGIGRALTEHRLMWLSERTDVVYYNADEVNGPSIELHERLGFVEVARGILPPRRSNDELQMLGKKRLHQEISPDQ